MKDQPDQSPTTGPMSDERLLEIKRQAAALNYLPTKKAADELIAEVERLRERVADLESRARPAIVTAPRIDRVARILFVRHYTLHGDASEEWATQFWDWAVTEEHKGDCPQAQHKGPVTCSACIVDEWRADARAVMGAL